MSYSACQWFECIFEYVSKTTDQPTGQPRGRESLLSPRRVETIIDAIEKGNFIETAATLAGVSKSTYNTWKRRGENELRRVDSLEGKDASEIVDEFLAENEDKSMKETFESWTDPAFDQTEWPYVVFSVLLERARAKFAQDTIADIRTIAANTVKPDWRAHKWLLEITQPQMYGPRSTTVLEGNPEAPLSFDIPSPEQLADRVKQIQQARASN